MLKELRWLRAMIWELQTTANSPNGCSVDLLQLERQPRCAPRFVHVQLSNETRQNS